MGVGGAGLSIHKASSWHSRREKTKSADLLSAQHGAAVTPEDRERGIQLKCRQEVSVDRQKDKSQIAADVETRSPFFFFFTR